MNTEQKESVYGYLILGVLGLCLGWFIGWDTTSSVLSWVGHSILGVVGWIAAQAIGAVIQTVVITGLVLLGGYFARKYLKKEKVQSQEVAEKKSSELS